MNLELRGVSSIEDRVRLMTEQVRKSLRDPAMRKLGLEVTRECPARADLCELERVYRYVHGNVRYTGDISVWDTYQTAARTLEFAGGDCDDHSILVATLIMENGFRSAFRVTSHSGKAWEHVFCMAAVPKRAPTHFIALDTTIPSGMGGRLGLLPPNIQRDRTFWVA